MRVRNNIVQKEIMEGRKNNNDYIHTFMKEERERKFSMRMKALEVGRDMTQERRSKRDQLNQSRSQHNKSVSEEFGHRQLSNKTNAKKNVDYVGRTHSLDEAARGARVTDDRKTQAHLPSPTDLLQ